MGQMVLNFTNWNAEEFCKAAGGEFLSFQQL
jgi:hypothetical protein